jgi:WD40 repeat protein
VSGSIESVLIWSTETGFFTKKVVRKFKSDNPVISVAFSSDNKYVMIGTDNGRTDNGLVKRWPTKLYNPQSQSVYKNPTHGTLSGTHSRGHRGGYKKKTRRRRRVYTHA